MSLNQFAILRLRRIAFSKAFERRGQEETRFDVLRLDGGSGAEGVAGLSEVAQGIARPAQIELRIETLRV